MKKLASIITSLLIIVAMMPMGAFAQESNEIWDGNTDTSWYNETDTTFNLTTASELAGLALLASDGIDDFSGKTINLLNDIYLNENAENYESWKTTEPANSWYPIAFGAVFSGTFNGNNHKISGIYINADEDSYNIGFFATLSDATINNLNIVDSYICGGESVGGICGACDDSTINNCSNSGIVEGIGTYSSYVGGICGDCNTGNTIKNCTNSGNVYGIDCVGGICGDCYDDSQILNCSNTADIIGQDSVGGITGLAEAATIKETSNTGNVSGTRKVGGVVGDASESVTLSKLSNSGNVSGEETVGGVCGKLNENSTLKDSANSGKVTGSAAVGGIVGYLTIANVGDTTMLSNCLNLGAVSGTQYVGGVCGVNDGTIENCFYNSETIGDENAPTSTIGEEHGSTTNVKGLTTAELRSDDYISLFSNSLVNKTITFNDGSSKTTKQYIEGLGYSDFPTPTKENDTFLGWFNNKNFTGTAVTEISTTATGDIELFAKWQSDVVENNEDNSSSNSTSSDNSSDLTESETVENPSTGESFPVSIALLGGVSLAIFIATKKLKK